MKKSKLTISFVTVHGNEETPQEPIRSFDDDAVEAAAKKAEAKYGQLILTPQTGFPSFELFRDGESVGGG